MNKVQHIKRGSLKKPIEPSKSFATWKFEKRQYLGVKRTDGHYAIVDDTGSYYGNFRTVEDFKRVQKARVKSLCQPIAGHGEIALNLSFSEK